jgi:hypothetical protein
MRVNPLHDNVCATRIGMYRKEACYNCIFLSDCDQHYDEKTGEWDYKGDFPLACNSTMKVTKGGVYDREIAIMPFRD